LNKDKLKQARQNAKNKDTIEMNKSSIKTNDSVTSSKEEVIDFPYIDEVDKVEL
jgi:hypothetical protein